MPVRQLVLPLQVFHDLVDHEFVYEFLFLFVWFELVHVGQQFDCFDFKVGVWVTNGAEDSIEGFLVLLDICADRAVTSTDSGQSFDAAPKELLIVVEHSAWLVVHRARARTEVF